MLPALLHSCALIIALFVQTLDSPLAGAWLFFHLAGCALLLKDGYPTHKGPVWWACLVWLLALGISTFLLAPIRGGASVMWMLAAMPMLTLCLTRQHLQRYGVCFLGVLIVYACGLLAQWALDVQYTTYDYGGHYAWPLLNPNNAAAVLNLGLVPCVYFALRKPTWIIPAVLFALALGAAGSRAGYLAALAACGIIGMERMGRGFADTLIVGLSLAGTVACYAYPNELRYAVESFARRIPVWEASAQLLTIRPWTGLGLGAFPFYYARVRTEDVTAGFYAHNDLLQLAVEMGILGAAVFTALALTVALTTRRRNLMPACAMLAVFLQALVEFQFYVPAISILLGVALAWHRSEPDNAPLYR